MPPSSGVVSDEASWKVKIVSSSDNLDILYVKIPASQLKTETTITSCDPQVSASRPRRSSLHVSKEQRQHPLTRSNGAMKQLLQDTVYARPARWG